MAADEERTHLLLEPASVEDDETGGGEPAGGGDGALPAPPGPDAAPPADLSDEERTRLRLSPVPESRPAADEERTRLKLDSLRTAAEVDDDAKTRLRMEPVRVEAAVPTAGSPSTKSESIKAKSGGDERTRLMIGPIVLDDSPLAVLPPPAKEAGPIAAAIRRLGQRIEDVMHQRWVLGIVVAAVLAGIAPPFIDEEGQHPSSAGSLLASLALLVGSVAYAFAWLSQLRDGAGNASFRALVPRLRAIAQMVQLDLRELERRPLQFKLIISGQLIAGAALAALIAASIWSVARWLGGMNEPAGAVRAWCGGLLLAALALMRWGERHGVVPAAPDDLDESLAAAARLPALVDLVEPLPPSFIEGYTPLHRIVVALSQWPGTIWPDEASYRAALERHLRQHLPASKITRAKWLGPSSHDGIADLIIDDMVLIAVAQGFQPTPAARAISRVDTLARAWRDRPMILAVFDASRDAVFQSAATLSLVELHQKLPLLTARMPVRLI